MVERLLRFLRSRWDHLRSDRTSQIILLACLVSFPPAFYYGQLLVRALLLALLVFLLVAHSTINSWTELVSARLDPSLPPPVAFYRLFLVDPDVQSLVASARWFLNINISLLLLNNALWIPLVDVLLGVCFFLTFATADELHIRGTAVLGRPVDPPGAPGSGWRSGAEYVLGHAKNNPRRAVILAALGAGLGYAGKAVVDGIVQDRVNANQTVRQASADVQTAQRLSAISIGEESEKSRIRQAEEGEKSRIRLDEAREMSRIRLDEDSQRFKLLGQFGDTVPNNRIRELQSRPGMEPSALSPLAQVKPELPPPLPPSGGSGVES